MNQNTKTDRIALFQTFIKKLKNGTYKLVHTSRLVAKNQYKRTWVPTNSRVLARELNKGNLVIN